MKKNFCNDQARHLMQREAFSITETNTVWRLESGALRIDSMGIDEEETLIRLAMPGDMLGVESLLGVQDRFTVRALTPSRLVPIQLLEREMPKLLMDSVIRGYQRSREMVKLRTGSTEDRVKCLSLMLTEAGRGSVLENASFAMPTLADIAGIVHAAPETVCRVLTNLRQVSFLQDFSRTNLKYKRVNPRNCRVLTSSASTSSIAGACI